MARQKGIEQDDVFSASEADRWFERNASDLLNVDPSTDPVIRVVELSSVHPRSVLEIGAANGFRLATAGERWGARTVGVEPSAKAIADGRRRYRRVTLKRGTADALPVTGAFDLVIVNFVFHWIGRRRLLRAAAEIDRCVAEGGHLAIGDFYPRNLTRAPYHHLPDRDVYTYKQDYSAIFLASGLYRTIAVIAGSHARGMRASDASEEDRTAVSLLQKRTGSLYQEWTAEPARRPSGKASRR